MNYRRWTKAGVIIPAVLLFALATRLLWNWLFPDLFGLHPISFWQALGLLVISRLLFGWGKGIPYHRQGMRDKWAAMSPEERKDFHQRMKHHHHHHHFYEDRDERKDKQNN